MKNAPVRLRGRRSRKFSKEMGEASSLALAKAASGQVPQEEFSVESLLTDSRFT